MTEVITIILGAFLPPIIDLINKHIADCKIKYAVSILTCALIASGITLVGNGFNWQELIKNIGLIFISAQTIYKLYWKESSLRSL